MGQGSYLKTGQDIPIINKVSHQTDQGSGLGKLVLGSRNVCFGQPVSAEGDQEHNRSFDEVRRSKAHGTTQKGVPTNLEGVRNKLDLYIQTMLEEARAASNVILTMSIPPHGRRCRGLGEGIRMTTSEPKRMAPRGSSCRGERKPGEQRDPRPESWEDWPSDIDMSEINNIMSIKGALSGIYE